MRALWYTRTGPAAEVLCLGEQPDPVAGPGQALVRLHASGVNPADCNRRSGRGYAMEAPLVIPHSDGAGIVEAVGAGVDTAWIGRRVWLYNGQRGRPLGTGAQWIALDAGLITELPDNVGFAEGACLGIPGLTAWCALFADGDIRGQRVLVTGGAGAVGHYAVQMASWAGARVFATASPGIKTEQCLAGGAQQVFDRADPDCAERILEATEGQGIDRIVEVDFGGNLATSLKVLAVNGAISSYASRGNDKPVVPIYEFARKCARWHAFYLPSLPLALRQRAQAGMTSWLQGGPRMHRVVGPFSLEQAVAAHETVERGGKLGTVVVVPG